VPPLLDCSANDYLSAIARRIVEILSARSTALHHQHHFSDFPPSV
jgi:hypothetical protein